MAIVRRIYVYAIVAASLVMLLTGLAQLGSALLEVLLVRDTIGQGLRETLAMATALTLVGLPVWGLHWSWAQRMARPDVEERTSALRRLFLYGALAALIITIMVLCISLIQQVLEIALRTGTRSDSASVAREIWKVAVMVTFWAYYLRVTEQDRLAVGEGGASATLRRWYTYGAQVVGLITLLFGARALLETVLISVVQAGSLIWPSTGVLADIAQTLVGLTVWAFHTWWTARPILVEEDQQSTLRTLAGFLALALSVALTLMDSSRTLYYALARLLGVESPGGVRSDVLTALVAPLSTVVIFGGAWWHLQRGLRTDSARSEAARQAGVRRLYTHLVALLSLLTFAAGMVLVLFTLVDLTLGAQYARPDAWRDQLSLALTLVVVGLPMWLAHWRPAPVSAERLALSRRLYLFAALLVAVLALLGSAAVFVYRLLALVLAIGSSQSPTADMGHALSVSLVAAGVATYHWRTLRQDNHEREQLVASAQEPVAESAPPLTYVVEVTGATADQIRQALVSLPGDARYEIRAR